MGILFILVLFLAVTFLQKSNREAIVESITRTKEGFNELFFSDYSGLTATWSWEIESDLLMVEYAEKVFKFDLWNVRQTKDFWVSKIHYADRRVLRAIINKCLEEDINQYKLELRVRNRFWKYIPLNCSGRVHQNSEGKPTMLTGIYTVK